jgi:hypothetical protein
MIAKFLRLIIALVIIRLAELSSTWTETNSIFILRSSKTICNNSGNKTLKPFLPVLLKNLIDGLLYFTISIKERVQKQSLGGYKTFS